MRWSLPRLNQRAILTSRRNIAVVSHRVFARNKSLQHVKHFDELRKDDALSAFLAWFWTCFNHQAGVNSWATSGYIQMTRTRLMISHERNCSVLKTCKIMRKKRLKIPGHWLLENRGLIPFFGQIKFQESTDLFGTRNKTRNFHQNHFPFHVDSVTTRVSCKCLTTYFASKSNTSWKLVLVEHMLMKSCF